MWIPRTEEILTCGSKNRGNSNMWIPRTGRILTCGFQEQREILTSGFQKQGEF
jgi:hypothetical protein